MPDRLPEDVRQSVLQRAGHCCEYCLAQSTYSSDPLTVEHIQPRSAGGSNEPDNLAAACQGCNNIKFTATEAVDPVTGETVPMFHPRVHVWADHFSWTDDGSIVIGRTPIGRATVERLRLNRPGVVNLRQVLVAIGRHPPVQIE
jgi:hypothetical protein